MPPVLKINFESYQGQLLNLMHVWGEVGKVSINTIHFAIGLEAHVALWLNKVKAKEVDVWKKIPFFLKYILGAVFWGATELLPSL